MCHCTGESSCCGRLVGGLVDSVVVTARCRPSRDGGGGDDDDEAVEK